MIKSHLSESPLTWPLDQTGPINVSCWPDTLKGKQTDIKGNYCDQGNRSDFLLMLFNNSHVQIVHSLSQMKSCHYQGKKALCRLFPTAYGNNSTAVRLFSVQHLLKLRHKKMFQFVPQLHLLSITLFCIREMQLGVWSLNRGEARWIANQFLDT